MASRAWVIDPRFAAQQGDQVAGLQHLEENILVKSVLTEALATSENSASFPGLSDARTTRKEDM